MVVGLFWFWSTVVCIWSMTGICYDLYELWLLIRNNNSSSILIHDPSIHWQTFDMHYIPFFHDRLEYKLIEKNFLIGSTLTYSHIIIFFRNIHTSWPKITSGFYNIKMALEFFKTYLDLSQSTPRFQNQFLKSPWKI